MRSNRASKTGIQLKMFRKQLTKQFRGLSIIHTVEQCEGSNFSSAKCNVIDHVDHFFYSCEKTRTIWDKVNFVISNKLNKNTSLTVTDVLFGVHEKNVSNKDNIFINHVIAIAKLCISKYRYGNHSNLLFLFDHEFNIRYSSQG